MKHRQGQTKLADRAHEPSERWPEAAVPSDAPHGILARWQNTTIAPDETHHLLQGQPFYPQRFQQVLKYHAPGLAPVRDDSGAYHIDLAGSAAYPARFRRTFGFYEGVAAVDTGDGWQHIRPDGAPLTEHRFEWCGNFQGERCTVRQAGRYFHIDIEGASAYDARYRYAGDFRDGVAVVQNDAGQHTHIDADGLLVHGRWFQDLDVYHKGLARARDATGWCHVDERGTPVYMRRFVMVEPFYNGQARVETMDGGLEVIDEQGTTLLVLRPGHRSELDQLSSDLVGFWRTQTLRAGVELGVFEALPETAERIAKTCQLPVDSTQRLLRALWELGVVVREGVRWRATARGHLLTREHPLSLADAARIWGTDHELAWGELVRALRTGRPAFERDGQAWFEWLSERPSDRLRYHSALASYARNDYRAFPEQVDLSVHTCLIDAGGGTGGLLFHALRCNPKLHGVLLDRPEVVALADIAPTLWTRCRTAAADLFRPWPLAADGIVLARVLHDWSDAEAIRILRRARAALMASGRIYILEMLLEPDSGNGGMLDLNMLVMTGGRERTLEDFRRLLTEADLELSEVRELPSVSAILIARGRS